MPLETEAYLFAVIRSGWQNCAPSKTNLYKKEIFKNLQELRAE